MHRKAERNVRDEELLHAPNKFSTRTRPDWRCRIFIFNHGKNRGSLNATNQIAPFHYFGECAIQRGNKPGSIHIPKGQGINQSRIARINCIGNGTF